MSRYRLQTNDEFAVFAGWDNPLQTFFVQKYENYDQENEEIVFDVGMRYNQIANIDDLESVLKDNGIHLDTYFYNVLFDDYLDRIEPTPLQKNVNSMFEKFFKENNL